MEEKKEDNISENEKTLSLLITVVFGITIFVFILLMGLIIFGLIKAPPKLPDAWFTMVCSPISLFLGGLSLYFSNTAKQAAKEAKNAVLMKNSMKKKSADYGKLIESLANISRSITQWRYKNDEVDPVSLIMEIRTNQQSLKTLPHLLENENIKSNYNQIQKLLASFDNDSNIDNTGKYIYTPKKGKEKNYLEYMDKAVDSIDDIRSIINTELEAI